MKLVSDWKNAATWFSVQIPILNTAFLATWTLLPAKFQEALPVTWVAVIAIALLLLGVVGRVIDQSPPPA